MKQIELTSNKYKNLHAQVSDEDYYNLSKYIWYPHVGKWTTYAYRKEGNNNIRMHRDILNITDPNIHIDHIDHDGLNNQRNNIRIVTTSQNMMNKRKSKSYSTSKYKGVSYTTRRRGLDTYWVAQCTSDHSTNKVSKLYKTEVEAALGYNEMAIELHGEYACLNILTKEDQIKYKELQEYNKSIEGKSFCNKCKEYLPYTDFRKGSSKGKTDGCSSYCRKCFREYEKVNGWNSRKRKK